MATAGSVLVAFWIDLDPTKKKGRESNLAPLQQGLAAVVTE